MREGHIRRPGEAVFSILMAAFSLFLLWKAIEIDGFSALSSSGALPMGAAATMVVSAVLIAMKTLKSEPDKTETFAVNILPRDVWTGVALIIAYAVLLVPLGFLPTSFLFLFVMTKALSGRSWFFCLWTSAVTLVSIYLVFRVVFAVLMPEGIVPEGQILAWFGKLLSGGK
ncbi:MAG: tripartite tricarboxylate transporter TctB family protein [Methylobacteriaceae bacterium]|nr:tripartite tricarboxylate transporter TctB family protein [Methylobacteriaceae bacterium]